MDQETFLGTFTSDGYYSAQPLGSRLLVIGLNTNSFVTISPSIAQAPAERGWLDSQLASAQAAGQKVWILMHIPPGAYTQGMASDTPGQLDDDNVSMNWDADYQSMFLQTLAKYPGLVTLMLAGHTHMDEYRLLSSGDVLEQLPGISPCFGNNPAYKVLMITQDAFLPVDYESFDYDLSSLPAQFNSLYTFSSVYHLHGTLNRSLRQLYPQLTSDRSRRDMYTYYYASGSTALNPLTNALWNPIDTANWPIFSCAIGQIDEPYYIACVNAR